MIAWSAASGTRLTPCPAVVDAWLPGQTMGMALVTSGVSPQPAAETPDGTVVLMSCYTAQYSGALAASSEIDELAWFGYADRPRVPPVDRLLFDDLNAAGWLR